MLSHFEQRPAVMFRTTIRTFPVTIVITLVTLIAAISPPITSALQLDVGLVAGGQWWRVITGHVTHWGMSHLFWDLSMFVVLSAVCESRHRRWYTLATIASLSLISAAVGAMCPTITIYRGLSGIDTGLFVWFVVDQIRISVCRGDKAIAAASAAAVVALMVKLTYEATTGGILFVDSRTFEPLVESHLAGAVCGLFCAAIGVAYGHTKTPFQRDIVGHPITSKI